MSVFDNLFPKRSGYAVLVTDGTRGGVFPVNEVVGYNDGFVLRYKNSNGQKDMVYIGRDYRAIEVDGVYWVGKRSGNNSGATITYEEDGQRSKVKVAVDAVGPSTDPDCPGEDLSALIRGDSFATGYRALYERRIPWKVILLIGAAVLVLVVVYMIAKSRGAV